VNATDPTGLRASLILVSPAHGQEYEYGAAYRPSITSKAQDPSYFSIVGHGQDKMEKAVIPGVTGALKDQRLPGAPGIPLVPAHLAAIIQTTPGYRPGQTVTLLSCYSGAGANIPALGMRPYAQHLANALGADVWASPGIYRSRFFGNKGDAIYFSTFSSLEPVIRFHPERQQDDESTKELENAATAVGEGVILFFKGLKDFLGGWGPASQT
jgi:hypothetical protein